MNQHWAGFRAELVGDGVRTVLKKEQVKEEVEEGVERMMEKIAGLERVEGRVEEEEKEREAEGEQKRGVVEVKEFPGRTHYIVGQDGWEEVADYALSWATTH